MTEVEDMITKCVSEGKYEDAVLGILYKNGDGPVHKDKILTEMNDYLAKARKVLFTESDLEISLKVLESKNFIDHS